MTIRDIEAEGFARFEEAKIGKLCVFEFNNAFLYLYYMLMCFFKTKKNC